LRAGLSTEQGTSVLSCWNMCCRATIMKFCCAYRRESRLDVLCTVEITYSLRASVAATTSKVNERLLLYLVPDFRLYAGRPLV
jgi:hypothetical protein